MGFPARNNGADEKNLQKTGKHSLLKESGCNPGAQGAEVQTGFS